MKFDDSDEDYFLHDFSEDKKKTQPAPRQELPAQSGRGVTNRKDDYPSFDFGDEPEDDEIIPSAPKMKSRRGWVWFFLIVFVVLAITVGIRYFVPYVTESNVTGYVTLVERRGIVFPTFEGEMVSESQLADTERVYSRDVYFSIPDEETARRLQQYQGSDIPVTITCKRYFGTLPWRGASNNIVVSFQPKH
ncbi:MAG: hypothetical protein K2M71_09720 [Duncaniella sp.]|nr:hypothetical protein [Duncaniella sp.]